MLRTIRPFRGCNASAALSSRFFRRALSTEVTSTASPTTQRKSDLSQTPAEQLASLIPKRYSSLYERVSPLNTTDVLDNSAPSNIATAITIKSLMAANLHLGHSPEVWNRNMLSYIYGERQGIHIINLEHTLVMLRRAINVTREVALRGGNIVFVGTRLFMHRITVEAAKKGDAYFVTKWVAGSITNKERVLRRSVGFDPDKVAQAAAPDPNATTEDEASPIKLASSRQPYVHLPDLLIVLDYANNASAVREANQMNIPVIAICDTDTDPQRVQYPIPANDDSAAGIELIAGALSLASKEGSRMRAVREKAASRAEAGRFAQGRPQR